MREIDVLLLANLQHLPDDFLGEVQHLGPEVGVGALLLEVDTSQQRSEVEAVADTLGTTVTFVVDSKGKGAASDIVGLSVLLSLHELLEAVIRGEDHGLHEA